MMNSFITPILPLNYTDESNQLYVKRDDLLPFSFGGNKVRVAGEYFRDMLHKGHNCIISYGSETSNLNRVIANMSKSLKIPCYIVTPIDDLGKRSKAFNSIIVNKIGTKVITCNKNNVADTVDNTIKLCKKEGLKPYYINGDKYGKGNEAVAVNAYVKTYEEIRQYERAEGFKFDYIFHASGTGITQAGLVCGQLMNNDNKKIIGISIARDGERGTQAIKDRIVSYLNNIVAEELDNYICFSDDYTCGGYGKYNYEIIELIDKILVSDGIPLDKTYTGKAFWGMTEYIKCKKIKGSKILFIHTGGTPLFFDDLIVEKGEDK